MSPRYLRWSLVLVLVFLAAGCERKSDGSRVADDAVDVAEHPARIVLDTGARSSEADASVTDVESEYDAELAEEAVSALRVDDARVWRIEKRQVHVTYPTLEEEVSVSYTLTFAVQNVSDRPIESAKIRARLLNDDGEEIETRSVERNVRIEPGETTTIRQSLSSPPKDWNFVDHFTRRHVDAEVADVEFP